MSTEARDFELRNVGAGPDPLSLSALATEYDFAVLLLQRDHYCTNCRKQVQSVADRYEEFRERDAVVVSVVPEPPERVEQWQTEYDLPFPLIADPDAAVGDAYDQPVRFGIIGDLSDFLGRMPVATIIDLRGDSPEIVWRHQGRSTFDRPSIDDILAELDAHRDS
ncbi:MAG: redoxin domain-containing protein [Halobacteriales archaeon]|nr:redoxin domain-containing protein [Halobacteriales archaeon]